MKFMRGIRDISQRNLLKGSISSEGLEIFIRLVTPKGFLANGGVQRTAASFATLPWKDWAMSPALHPCSVHTLPSHLPISLQKKKRKGIFKILRGASGSDISFHRGSTSFKWFKGSQWVEVFQQLKRFHKDKESHEVRDFHGSAGFHNVGRFQ